MLKKWKTLKADFKAKKPKQLLNRGSFICMSKKNTSLKCEPIVPKCSVSFQSEQHPQTWNLVRYSQERHLFKLLIHRGFQRVIHEFLTRLLFFH